MGDAVKIDALSPSCFERELHVNKIPSEPSGTLHKREDTNMICFIRVVVAPFGYFAFLSAVSSKEGGSH